MALLIVFTLFFFFVVYLLIDLLRTGNINTFMDNWLRYTLWIWLPFYAFWRLTKEVIFKGK